MRLDEAQRWIVESLFDDYETTFEEGKLGVRTAQLERRSVELAAAKGCAFWDALAFMGGEGSMALWVQSTPQMGRADYIHLTRRGYVRLGMAFTDALMQGFD